MRSSAAEKMQSPAAANENVQKKEAAQLTAQAEKMLKVSLALNASKIRLLEKEYKLNLKDAEDARMDALTMGEWKEEGAGSGAEERKNFEFALSALEQLRQSYLERKNILEDSNTAESEPVKAELTLIDGALEAVGKKIRDVSQEKIQHSVRESLRISKLTKEAVPPPIPEAPVQPGAYKPSRDAITQTAGEINAEADAADARAKAGAAEETEFEETEYLHEMKPAEVSPEEKVASNATIDVLKNKEPIRKEESFQTEWDQNLAESASIKEDLFTKFTGCVQSEYSGKLKMVNEKLLTPNQVVYVSEGVNRFNQLFDQQADLADKLVSAKRAPNARKTAGFGGATEQPKKGGGQGEDLAEDPFAAVQAELADTRASMKALETSDRFLTAAIAGGRVAKDPIKGEYAVKKSAGSRFVSFLIGKNDNEKAIDAAVEAYNQLAQDERNLVNEAESLRVAEAPEAMHGPKTAEDATLAYMAERKKRQEKYSTGNRPSSVGGPGGLVK